VRIGLPGFRGLPFNAAREMFRTFRPALRGQGFGLASSLGLTLLVVTLDLLRPWPIKVLFDRVLMPVGPASGPWGLSARATLIAAALATVCIAALHGILSAGSALAGARVSKKLTVRVRRQVFDHLHRLALPFHLSSRTGDLLIRLMGDVNAVRDAMFMSWIDLISRGLLFAATATVMLVLEPWLALLALLPVPLLALELGKSSKELRNVARKQRQMEGGAAAFAAETLRHIRLVKAYATEERSTRQFAQDSRSGERAGLKAARISADMDRKTEILTGVGLALVLFVGAHWVLAGRLSAGTLLVFLSYTRSMYKPVRKASGQGARLSKAVASAGRLIEVLRIPPEDSEAGRAAPRFRGDLALRDVRYVHPGGLEALRGVSLDVRGGELAVLQGPNGSGKTTLASVLLRLMSPDDGEVLIDGEPVDVFQLQSYRGRFAYVPQDIQLFGATVRENILYGRPDGSPEEVEVASRAALFHEVAQRLPDGYDTALGEGGATLSGGEARRLMLARAALRQARILLLDEPLAGLDPQARAIVSSAIRRIASGRTTIVISHGPALEVDPDVVFHLREGRVAEVETPSQAQASVAEDRAESTADSAEVSSIAQFLRSMRAERP
jgi:ATP-binding cassette subfamily B protein